LKLHHIGIVVKNIQESLGELTKFLNYIYSRMIINDILYNKGFFFS